MSFMDKAKNLTDKAKEYGEQHDEQVSGGIDKAQDQVSKRTGGKYDGKVDSVADKADEQLTGTVGVGREGGGAERAVESEEASADEGRPNR